MLAYIIRRLSILPILLLGVTILVFVIFQFLSPAMRASLYLRDVPRSPDAMERIIKKYGLDEPIYIQYWKWLNQVVRGDLGWSQTAQRPVTEALLYYLPATLELSLWAMLPVILVGIWLGILAAVHQDKLIDQTLRVFALVGWSFPTFVFGLLLLMKFYADLQWFPAGQISDWVTREIIAGTFVQYTRMYTVDALLNGRLDVFLDSLRHLVLPVITLAYVQWALLLRVTRSSMLETLRQEYVMVARGKGLKERVVINKHAARNAMIPVATMGGLLLIGLLNGVVLTETVFNYPGIGRWAANAATSLDILGVLGFTLFNGVLLVVGNLVVDVLYAFIDPRVRLE